jgi:hypothetical protein
MNTFYPKYGAHNLLRNVGRFPTDNVTYPINKIILIHGYFA